MLRQGSSGNAVRVLQRALGGLSVDGAYGPRTAAAVSAFQKAHRLPVTGVTDARVWKALEARDYPLLAYRSTVLKKGSAGGAVVVLQRALRITADGQFGPQTEAAVKALQGRAKIARTGVVASVTWQALEAELAPPLTRGVRPVRDALCPSGSALERDALGVEARAQGRVVHRPAREHEGAVGRPGRQRVEQHLGEPGRAGVHPGPARPPAVGHHLPVCRGPATARQRRVRGGGLLPGVNWSAYVASSRASSTTPGGAPSGAERASAARVTSTAGPRAAAASDGSSVTRRSGSSSPLPDGSATTQPPTDHTASAQ